MIQGQVWGIANVNATAIPPAQSEQPLKVASVSTQVKEVVAASMAVAVAGSVAGAASTAGRAVASSGVLLLQHP